MVQISDGWALSRKRKREDEGMSAPKAEEFEESQVQGSWAQETKGRHMRSRWRSKERAPEAMMSCLWWRVRKGLEELLMRKLASNKNKDKNKTKWVLMSPFQDARWVFGAAPGEAWGVWALPGESSVTSLESHHMRASFEAPRSFSGKNEGQTESETVMKTIRFVCVCVFFM